MQRHQLMARNFWETVPPEKRALVARKLPEYLARLAGPLCDQSRGMYVRCLQGAPQAVYKFRVNSGDRILFMYARDIAGLRGDVAPRSVVLLEYCRHDAQVRRGGQLDPEAAAAGALDVSFCAEPYDEGGENEACRQRQRYWSGVPQLLDAAAWYLASDEGLAQLVASGRGDWQLYLSQEQYACVRQEGEPLFLAGGAGTGKSTVGLHKLMARSGQEASLGYFTYAKRLRDDTEQLYRAWSEAAPRTPKAQVSFHCFGDYCRERLGFQEHQVVHFRAFAGRFWPVYGGGLELSAAAAWQEIRGLLKGGMGRCWLRQDLLAARQYPLQAATAAWLEELGFWRDRGDGWYEVRRQGDSQGLFSPPLPAAPEGAVLREARQLAARLQREVYQLELLPEATYLHLPADHSLFDGAQRRQAYLAAQRYQQWLKSQGLVDENDLARLLLARLAAGRLQPPFDYLVVDEVQDLSELQLYLLLALKGHADHDFHSFLFSGDVQQTINPTYFDFGRLRMPFHYRGYRRTRLQVLTKNYRCRAPIVALGNGLAALRRQWCGATDEEETQLLQPLLAGEDKPQWLRATAYNRQALLAAAADAQRGYVTVLVADEQERQKLRAAGYPRHNIHTVQEFKGAEDDYIIAFNLLSACRQAWEELLAGRGRGQLRLRYCANLLYVALTRAKERLCFYEEQPPAGFLAAVSPWVEEVERFEAPRLGLQGLSAAAALLAKARSREREEYFLDASDLYAQAGDSRGAARCRGAEEEAAGNLAQALAHYDEAGEWQRVLSLAQELGEDGRALKALLHLGAPYGELEASFAPHERRLAPLLAACEADGELRRLARERYWQPKLQAFAAACDECAYELDFLALATSEGE